MGRLLGSSKSDAYQERKLIVPPWCSFTSGYYAKTDAYFLGSPPLKVYPDGHVDLDYGPLLLVDKLILDRSSTERFADRARNHIPNIFQNMSVLENEGFLQYEDLKSKVGHIRSGIKQELEGELLRLPFWLPKLRRAVIGWEEQRHGFVQAIPDVSDTVTFAASGISSAIVDAGLQLTTENAEKVRRIIFSNARRRTRFEKEIIGAAASVYIEYAIANLMLQKEVAAPFVDWGNVGDIYLGKVGILRADTETSQIAAAKMLFSLAIPSLAPKNAKELLTILRDTRLKSLRRLISDSVAQNRSLDQEFGQDVLLRLAEFNRTSGKVRRGISAAGAVVGIATAFVPIAGPIIGAVMSGSTSVAQEAIGETTDRWLGSDLDWLFCLIDHTRLSTVRNN